MDDMKKTAPPVKIFLTGLMGSGKTTLGRQLAEAMGVRFVDLDEAVVVLAGQSIPEVFERQGEEAFRSMEAGMLEQFCSSEDAFVMATGGGTPCFGSNMDRMKDAGTTIFLDVPAEELARRLAPDSSSRPLISRIPPSGLKDFLKQLLDQRKVHYSRADFILRGENIGISDFQQAGIF